MLKIIEPGRYFHITGDTPHDIQEHLNTAVGLAQDHARKDGRQGILLTRHGHGSYIVSLTAGVPYGITHERCLM